MFAYLTLVSEEDLTRWEFDVRVGRAADTALGWIAGLRSRQWTSPTRRSRLWVWTNESEDVSGELTTSIDAAMIRIGTLDADSAALLHAEDVPTALKGKAGDYSLCRLLNDQAVAISTFARQVPVYHVISDGAVCLTNRALLAHLFDQGDGLPQFDLDALASCATSGYESGGFWSELTPFKGVELAPSNSVVEGDRAEVTVRDNDGAHERFGFGDAVPDKAFYDDLAEVFLAGMSRLDLPAGIEVGLTGGKDSRVLVAAMTNLDLEFRTGTVGFDTDPDVVIAKRLAEYMKLPHDQVVPPSSTEGEEPTVSWDLRGNIARELLVYDGMMFTVPRLPRGVSNVSTTLGARFSTSPAISTKGAEVWRSGYANRDFSWISPDASADDVSAEHMERVVRNIWLGNAANLRPEIAERHNAYVTRWLESSPLRERPTAVAERFYLDFEIGRRDPAFFFLYELNRPTYQPFMQHEILRRIGELDVRFRRDDHIHYELISRFARGVEDFPLERKRWGFEWTGPRSEAERGQWEARAPLPVTDRAYGAWPLHGAVGSDFPRIVADQIFSYEDETNVWSFLSRQTIHDLFFSERIFDPSVSASLWVIYGLSIFMSGNWLSRTQPEVIITARHLRPWPAIYAELVSTLRVAQEAARSELVTALDEFASAAADKDEVLLDLESESDDGHGEIIFDTPRLGEATTYAGTGRQVMLGERADEDSEPHWHVHVEGEPGSGPATSYLSLPLGQIAESERKRLSVTFKHRAEGATRARAWLVRWGSEKIELDGPVLDYADNWQVEDFTFERTGPPAKPGEELDFTLLLGLGSDPAEVYLADLCVVAHRRTSPALTLVNAVRRGLASFADAIEEALGKLRAEHELDDSGVESLRRRAGLDAAVPSVGEDEFDPLVQWAWTEARRAEEPGAEQVGERLLESGARKWSFLVPFNSLADDVLGNLLQGSTPGE